MNSRRPLATPVGRSDTWLDVRDPRSGKLLFRYNPETQQIHIRRGNSEAFIDLRRYAPPCNSP